jgi:hypothetical protein
MTKYYAGSYGNKIIAAGFAADILMNQLPSSTMLSIPEISAFQDSTTQKIYLLSAGNVTVITDDYQTMEPVNVPGNGKLDAVTTCDHGMNHCQ